MKNVARLILWLAWAMPAWDTPAETPRPAASAQSATPAAQAGGKLNVVVIAMREAATALNGPQSGPILKNQMNAIFSNDTVEFFLQPDPNQPYTRERFAAAILRANILYVCTHSIAPYPLADGSLSQGVYVGYSASNPDRSPGGNPMASAAYLTGMLQGKPGPRLTIFNGCGFTNPNDRVAAKNRISSALGIGEGTKDRAFVGWDFSVIASNYDGEFVELFRFWTTRGATGYPTIQEAINSVQWGNNKPRIVGDPSLRYK